MLSTRSTLAHHGSSVTARGHCHPERIPRTREKSKDPAKLAVGCATGFLDFARNDGLLKC